MKCKYQENHKGYIICKRDNSRRTKGCPCPGFKSTFWRNLRDKIKSWFKENW